MATMVNVVGFASSVPGIISILQGVAPVANSKDSIVRIHVGLSNSDSTMGGNTPGVSLWDVDGHLVGSTDGTSRIIKEGNFVDIVVSPVGAGNNAPSEYLSVSNGGNDAICISAIAVTSPAGVGLGWTGDIGFMCGADWAYSETIVGTNGERPKCNWIDRDRSNGLLFQGMGIHLTDFIGSENRTAQYVNNPDTMCKSTPRFTMYPNMTTESSIPIYSPPLVYEDDLTDADISLILNPKTITSGTLKTGSTRRLRDLVDNPSSPLSKRNAPSRRIKRNTAFMAGRLITSTNPQHSAVELCQSETSVGADFVSTVEAMYCDMSEKQLWPLCSADVGQACFNTKTNTVRGSAGSDATNTKLTARGGVKGRVALDTVPVPVKAYTAVTRW